MLLFFTFLRELNITSVSVRRTKRKGNVGHGERSGFTQSQLGEGEEARVSKPGSLEEKNRVAPQMERTTRPPPPVRAKCYGRAKKCEEFGCCSSGCQHS